MNIIIDQNNPNLMKLIKFNNEDKIILKIKNINETKYSYTYSRLIQVFILLILSL